jgi:hypothetical protein
MVLAAAAGWLQLQGSDIMACFLGCWNEKHL